MLKTLLKSVREYKKDAILSPVIVSLEVVMDVIIPFLLAFLIDEGVEKGNINYIVKLGAVLVGLALLSLLFGALAGKFAAKASAGFAKNLRHDMSYNIQNFSF